MIDQDKMRALAARLRGPLKKFDNFAAGYSEAADAIDLLLAEVEAANMQLTVPDWTEGDDQAWDKVTPAVAWHLIERHGENWAHIDRMMQAYLDAHTATLRAELEAAAADKLDADRYRYLRSRPESVEPDRIDVVYWSALDESANEGDALRGDALDAAIDAALAQRQGEGS